MVESVELAWAAMVGATGVTLVLLGIALYATRPPPGPEKTRVLQARYAVAIFLIVLGLKFLYEGTYFTLRLASIDGTMIRRNLVGPVQIIHWSTVVGVLYVLPRPPSVKSLQGLLFLMFAGWVVVGVAMWLFNGGFFFPGWRLGEAPAGESHSLAAWLFIRYSGIGVILMTLLITTLVRTSRLENSGQVRVMFNLIPLLYAFPFWNFGRSLVLRTRNWQNDRLASFIEFRQNIPGDCCDIALYLTITVNLLIVGVFLFLISRRAFMVVIPVASGLFSALVLDNLTSWSLWNLVYLFPIAGILYSTKDDTLIGGFDVGPRGNLILSIALFVLGYLLTTMLVFALFPGTAFALPGSVLLGAAVGVTVALASHPHGRSWFARISQSTVELVGDHLDTYRNALANEVETGATPQEVSERLRPLRSRLGISEREHAVIDHMVRDSLETGKTAPRLLEEGTTFLGRYRVIEPLGMGGGGRVYLCHDERLDRDVVLKELKRQDSHDNNADLVREAKAFAKVHHPNVITLYDVEEVGDRAVLVMEHASGGSLSDRLKEGPLTETQVVRLAEDLLGGLSAVHEKKLVHRDVKPSNVLTDQDGSFKLGDFGVAHLPGFETTAFGFGDWENPVGTVRYMSPEQARGAPVGPSSDLYSAAVTIYEALTGTPYVNVQASQTPVEVQMAVASTKSFQHDLGDHKHLRRWFERALAASPEGRFKHAHEMLEALKTSARGEAEQ